MVSLNDASAVKGIDPDIENGVSATTAVTEDLIARLTLAAYDAALRQGIQGNFTDLQLEIWREIGQVIHQFQRGAPLGRLPSQHSSREWILEDSLT